MQNTRRALQIGLLLLLSSAGAAPAATFTVTNLADSDRASFADLYRVFCFLGLGASLLLLVWVYQRFRLRRIAVKGWLSALAWLLAATAMAAGKESVVYTREVQVGAPGWVKVPLDLAPGRRRGGLQVTDPAGKDVPAVGQFERRYGGERSGPITWIGCQDLSCRSVGLETRCRLELPERELWSLRLELADGEVTGYRIFQADSRLWDSPCEGRWLQVPRPAIRLLPVDLRLAGGPQKLELRGSSRAPRVLRCSAEMGSPQNQVLFRAEHAGRYRLRYGEGISYKDVDPLPASEAEAFAAWIEPGPETKEIRSGSLPPLPPEAQPVEAMPDVRFAAVWPVRAPGAKPGEVVRLEIPGEVYRTSRSNWPLLDMRLEAGGRQIPFYRDPFFRPEVEVLHLHGARPESLEGSGASRVLVPLPKAVAPRGILEVTTPALPFRRKVVLRHGETTLLEQDWLCRPQPPLPCRFVQQITPWHWQWQARELTLWFGDGGNRPLPSVDVTLWQAPESLFFVWPGERSVRLHAGRKGIFAASHSLPDTIDRYPWRTASLGPIEAERWPWPDWPPSATIGLGLVILAGIVWAVRRRSRRVRRMSA